MQQKLLILRINIGKNGKNNNIMATKKQEKQETQVAILTPKKVRGTATIYACGDVESTNGQMAEIFGITKGAVRMQLFRLIDKKHIERVKRGVYRKIIKNV